ncbi:unnamed protein product [Ilex paraguariensis]|uniref:Condensin-2 complex subunit H2 C-terminal domain-containing protein n=1 Tax=Ilex paraguariensis TaxID=185542 RepID=A0ABC8R3E9_9AQUA
MDYGYSEPRDLDNSDDEDDDDPWKPLNPYEFGNLKVKPNKQVKAGRRDGVNSCKRIPLTTEFPLARLHGSISSELNEIWEKQQHAFMESYMNEYVPLNPEKFRQTFNVFSPHDYDGSVHFDANEDMDLKMQILTRVSKICVDLTCLCPQLFLGNFAWLSQLLPSAIQIQKDSLLASIAETENCAELGRAIVDNLFYTGLHEYGGRVLDELLLKAGSGNATSFADLSYGQEKHDVARTFSALLQLVNNGDVDLERVCTDGESTVSCVRLSKEQVRKRELPR